MKNITIKQTPELTELVNLYGIESDKIIDRLLTILVESSSVIDDECSVDITISDYFS